MSAHFRSFGWLVALLCAGAVAHAEPSPASADDTPANGTLRDAVAARRAFERAERAFALAQYAEALRDFRAAFALAVHPAVHFNIAVCLERLERFDEALAEYQAAATDAALDDGGRSRARAEAERLRLRLSSLTIETIGPVQRLWVDERECPSPCRLHVLPGAHRVRLIDASGERRVSLETLPGETRTLRIPTISPPNLARPSLAASARAPEKKSERRAYTPGALAWTGGVVALSGAVGFTYFGLRSNALYDDYRTRPTRETRDRGLEAQTIANLAVGVALTGVALIVVDWLTAGERERAPRNPE